MAGQRKNVGRRRARTASTRPPKTGIGLLLRDANAAFNRYLTAQLATHGVTYGQFQHLWKLWEQNGVTQAELSRRIGIEVASSTAILESLEAAKLITRVRNATDRRKVNVFLTPAGAALEKPLVACAVNANKRATKGLTKAEVAQLFATAGRIVENFKTLRAAQAPRGRVRRDIPRAAE